jgi:hypothetical protein
MAVVVMAVAHDIWTVFAGQHEPQATSTSILRKSAVQSPVLHSLPALGELQFASKNGLQIQTVANFVLRHSLFNCGVAQFQFRFQS